MTTHTTKAARLMILYRLKQARLLEGLTHADIGRMLGCNRSTAFRLMHDLDEAEKLMQTLMKSARIKDE